MTALRNLTHDQLAERDAAAIEERLAREGFSGVAWLPTLECICLDRGRFVAYAKTREEGEDRLREARARRLGWRTFQAAERSA